VEKPTEFKKSRDASPDVAWPRRFACVPKWRSYIILMVKQWAVAMNKTCHLKLACFVGAEVNPASEYAIVCKSCVKWLSEYEVVMIQLVNSPVCNQRKFCY